MTKIVLTKLYFFLKKNCKEIQFTLRMDVFMDKQFWGTNVPSLWNILHSTISQFIISISPCLLTPNTEVSLGFCLSVCSMRLNRFVLLLVLVPPTFWHFTHLRLTESWSSSGLLIASRFHTAGASLVYVLVVVISGRSSGCQGKVNNCMAGRSSDVGLCQIHLPYMYISGAILDQGKVCRTSTGCGSDVYQPDCIVLNQWLIL